MPRTIFYLDPGSCKFADNLLNVWKQSLRISSACAKQMQGSIMYNYLHRHKVEWIGIA